MTRITHTGAAIRAALQTPLPPAEHDAILALGALTGLKSDGSIFAPANFERAIVLKAIIRERHPESILEIGTGRGFGAFTMVRAARAEGTPAKVTTVDTLGPDVAQRWPIRRNGREEVLNTSRNAVWSDPSLAADRTAIEEITGGTTVVLPRLYRSGRRFDFVFIDAGHDLFSVAHDLARSARLLTPDGCILMDDFAPLEPFGLGTCIAVSHARRFFAEVEVFPTDGVVFGGAAADGLPPRGMVFLSGPRPGGVRVSTSKLFLWRALSKVLDLCHSPGLFPAGP